MSALQPVGLGRHVTHLSVTMLTVNATTGALTPSLVIANLVTSTGALHTNLVHTKSISDDIEWMMTENTENIVAITSNRANWVSTRHGGQFTLVEILRPGANQCELRECAMNGPSRYALIEYARMQKLWTVYAKLSTYNEGYRQGKTVGRALFRLIDANTTPTYTTFDRP